jgi:hypothetical protein
MCRCPTDGTTENDLFIIPVQRLFLWTGTVEAHKNIETG